MTILGEYGKHRVSDGNSRNATATAVSVLVTVGGALAFSGLAYYGNRFRRSRWLAEEETDPETAHSVIKHFESLILDPETTVEEANKRRTTSYYLKMRESHAKSLVLGVGPLSALVRRRRKELGRALEYWHRGDQSHRTIVAMCDQKTASVLSEARRMILEPLGHSSDIHTSGAWIPDLNCIPEQDMHVTIALPWWWHTIREGNDELTQQMAQRFKQTLLLEFHYPFQIELERLILLGGKVLVALWRCVGNRTLDDGSAVIHDRNGENADPMVRLREEIIRCFITESPDQRRQPLTYRHSRMPDGTAECAVPEHDHTIKRKTPGMGVTADGFIHTTLCRLPLDCLSSEDVELDKIHRLCREASAALNGHRMIVKQYKFLETMGEGGESNPCSKPLYEEMIDAPLRHRVDIAGAVTERRQPGFKLDTSGPGVPLQRHGTVGTVRNFLGEVVAEESTNGSSQHRNTLAELFEPPENTE